MAYSGTKILLADPQPVFRQGIIKILEGDSNVYQYKEVGNTTELMDVINTFDPDILILDYNPDYFKPAALHHALEGNQHCRVIIISSQSKRWDIMKSLQFNVYCYLTKECGKMDICKAIHATVRGEKFFCTFILDVLLAENRTSKTENVCSASCLTMRETEIIKLIAEGKVSKQIAAQLHLSLHTVQTHRKNIMKKLQLHSALELHQYAIQHGLVHSADV